jgi:hypothetical protein
MFGSTLIVYGGCQSRLLGTQVYQPVYNILNDIVRIDLGYSCSLTVLWTTACECICTRVLMRLRTADATHLQVDPRLGPREALQGGMIPVVLMFQSHRFILFFFSSDVPQGAEADVEVRVKDSPPMRAHRIILHLRCPALLDSLIPPAEVSLNAFLNVFVLAIIVLCVLLLHFVPLLHIIIIIFFF